MQKIVGIIFILSWLLCGCTIDTIFDGGLPWFLVGMGVMLLTARILSDDNK